MAKFKEDTKEVHESESEALQKEGWEVINVYRKKEDGLKYHELVKPVEKPKKIEKANK
jgi:hypothetical protein